VTISTIKLFKPEIKIKIIQLAFRDSVYDCLQNGSRMQNNAYAPGGLGLAIDFEIASITRLT
jgi:hypothetical protein